ncbi:hypothetical protein niasHT_012168 [Heterodera trifolii]|uniref:BTB domain-containing protein n=1 Tax=Heterodera trifolii TaxID=157864 RepID=A0ABD2KUD2_9BILA
MKIFYPAFLCAFLNFLLLAQASPPKSDVKQSSVGKSNSIKRWFKSSKSAGKSKDKASSASSPSTHEADPQKTIVASSPSTIETDPKKTIVAGSVSTQEADPQKTDVLSSASTHKAEPKKSISSSSELKKCDLTSRMDSLLCSSEEADIYFLVKEEQTGKEQLIPAHKPNLLASSEFFATMFDFNEQNEQNKTWTADNPFVVTDISIEAFKIMLRFIYTDNFSEVNADNLLSVLHAADQYGVSALVDECVAFPISKMKNVFLALAEAQYIGVKSLNGKDFLEIEASYLKF